MVVYIISYDVLVLGCKIGYIDGEIIRFVLGTVDGIKLGVI